MLDSFGYWSWGGLFCSLCASFIHTLISTLWRNKSLLYLFFLSGSFSCFFRCCSFLFSTHNGSITRINGEQPFWYQALFAYYSFFWVTVMPFKFDFPLFSFSFFLRFFKRACSLWLPPIRTSLESFLSALRDVQWLTLTSHLKGERIYEKGRRRKKKSKEE